MGGLIWRVNGSRECWGEGFCVSFGSYDHGGFIHSCPSRLFRWKLVIPPFTQYSSDITDIDELPATRKDDFVCNSSTMISKFSLGGRGLTSLPCDLLEFWLGGTVDS